MGNKRKASRSGFDYAHQPHPQAAFFPPNYPGAAVYPTHAYPTGYAGYMNGSVKYYSDLIDFFLQSHAYLALKTRSFKLFRFGISYSPI